MGLEGAGEVGYDHDGALEYADQQYIAAFVVLVDLGGKFLNLGVDFFFAEENVLDVVLYVECVHG